MPIVEDEALILRALRYSDTSRIAIACARRCGVIHLLAKGARDPKSPFGAALEPLGRSAIIFYHKKERELHLLRSASVLDPHLGLLRDPFTYHLAAAAAEFAMRVLPGEEPNPEIYDLLARYLEHLDRREAGAGPREEAAFKRFQLRVAALLGYAPELTRCAHCRAPAGEAPAGFGVAEGGLVCRRCTAEGESLPLGREALLRLRAIAASPGIRAANGSAPGAPSPVSREASRQMDRVIEAFLRYHLPNYAGLRALRSLADWTQLRGASRPKESAPDR